MYSDYESWRARRTEPLCVRVIREVPLRLVATSLPKAVLWYSGKQDMTAEVVDAIPLSKDAHGVYRVGGSRVTLDLVVRAFNRGATPEEITPGFPESP